MHSRRAAAGMEGEMGLHKYVLEMDFPFLGARGLRLCGGDPPRRTCMVFNIIEQYDFRFSFKCIPNSWNLSLTYFEEEKFAVMWRRSTGKNLYGVHYYRTIRQKLSVEFSVYSKFQRLVTNKY